MKNRIYQIIERSDGSDILSKIYDIFMIVTIIISLIPLAFKADIPVFVIIDKTAMVIFVFDYLLRWITADLKFGSKKAIFYLKYPFTPMAIIDLLSILPSLSIINSGFKALRILRMIRAFRVFRVFKAFRYSKSFQIIGNVIKNSKKSLVAVGILAVGYIFVSALIIFNVEPESFHSFFDAIYWATVSLTTVGYGDIYPVSTLGRIITMLSSIFGIAIVALPAGIITAGYISELNKSEDDNIENNSNEK